jgi:3-(3-hydroxy-phenyl)propionate hydroxylase
MASRTRRSAGDAAHLITPIWALGLNTGILDANNLAWRIAWIMRGWASQTLLDGFESEQKPVAEQGSGEMAEAGRAYMASRIADVKAMSGHAWGNAYTRSLLGVRLGLNGTGDWSMVKPFAEPPPVVVGDRAPDGVVHDSAGHETRLHDLFGRSFVALYFTDVRRRRTFPQGTSPGSGTMPSRAGMPRGIPPYATARCSTPATASRSVTAASPTPWCW